MLLALKNNFYIYFSYYLSAFNETFNEIYNYIIKILSLAFLYILKYLSLIVISIGTVAMKLFDYVILPLVILLLLKEFIVHIRKK